MMDYTGNLQIDREFRGLKSPLSKAEYEQLTLDLLRDGCKDAICVWNGRILDGYKRYDICLEYGIPYQTAAIALPDRDAAIVWVCRTQLEKRSIADETRKYLIGKRYGAEKRLASLSAYTNGAHTHKAVYYAKSSRKESMHRTAAAVAVEYSLCPTTVQQYSRYTLAVDRVGAFDNELAARILSGKTKISISSVVCLSKMPESIFRQACAELSSGGDACICHSHTQKVISVHMDKARRSSMPTVKDMPAFDPDSELSSLTLTIPSWRDCIGRAYSSLKRNTVSATARSHLAKELYRLVSISDQFRSILEDNNT